MEKNEFWKAYSKITRTNGTDILSVELEKSGEIQLTKLIINSIAESIKFQQVLHDWFAKNDEQIEFYYATMWHLTHALYETPEKLLRENRFPPHLENESKATSLCEYYSFLVAFKQLAPQELLNEIKINNNDYLALINTKSMAENTNN